MELGCDSCPDPTGEILGPLLRTAEGASSLSPGHCSAPPPAPGSSTSVPHRDGGPGSQGLTGAHKGTQVLSVTRAFLPTHTYTPQCRGPLSGSGHHPLSSALTWFPSGPPRNLRTGRSSTAGRDIRHLRPGSSQNCLCHWAPERTRPQARLCQVLEGCLGDQEKKDEAQKWGPGWRCSRWRPAGPSDTTSQRPPI